MIRNRLLKKKKRKKNVSFDNVPVLTLVEMTVEMLPMLIIVFTVDRCLVIGQAFAQIKT